MVRVGKDFYVVRVGKDFWGCLLLVGNAGGLAAICVANSDIRSYPKLD